MNSKSVGGESGAGARPLDQAWVESIRNQCQRQDVAFFFKQWGGFQKKKAGRELDGRTYDSMPPVAVADPPDENERLRRVRDADALSRRFYGAARHPLLRVAPA